MKVKTKRIIAIVAIFMLLFNLVPAYFTEATNDMQVTIRLEADRTSANPGDEITYTLYLNSTRELSAFQATLNIPEGLTFVSNSGKKSQQSTDLKDLLDDTDTQWQFTESSKYLSVLVNSDYYAFNNIPVLKFKCTVDSNANSDNYTVSLTDVVAGYGYNDPENEIAVAGRIPASQINLDLASNVEVNGANQTVNPSGIEINKTTLTLDVGGSEQLTATVSPDNATDKTVTWESTATQVATVDNEGNVTAVGAGTTTILAKTVNKFTAECTVTVNSVNPTGVELNKTTLTLDIGASEQLTATVSPDNATDKNVIWISSNPSVVSVNNGNVTALTAGSSTITVQTVNNKTATCEVTVNPVDPTGVELNKSTLTLNVGGREQLTATVSPDNATDKNVIWISSNPSVASVNEAGEVVALAKGTTTITVQTTNNKTATCEVTIIQPITGIDLNKTEFTLANGSSETLTASKLPTNADGTLEVNWSSSNTDVATVDSTGKVTVVVCEGSATITATLKTNASIKATAVVTAKHPATLTHVPAVASTCKDKGNTEYWVCPECDKYFADSAGTTEITDKTSVEVAVNPSAHTAYNQVAEVPATCTEGGVKAHYKCPDCGKVFLDSTGTVETTLDQLKIDPLGHDWNDWVVTTEPTEESTGLKERTCKHDATHKETEIIPELEHVHNIVPVAAVSATCTDEGNIAYYKCTKCGKFYTDESAENEITDKTSVVISALGHDWDEGTVTTAPTCTEPGVKTFECSRCDETKTESVPALGHNWNEGTVTTNPTCTEPGVKTFECSRCDETKTEPVPALGHDWDEGTVTTAPTCTEPGVKTFECSRCDETKTEPIPALGHDWDEWVVTKESTEDETGSKTRTCKTDPTHTETVEIPKLPHTHVLTKVEAVPATYTTEGNKEYYTCSGCEDWFLDSAGTTVISDKSSVVIPKLKYEILEGNNQTFEVDEDEAGNISSTSNSKEITIRASGDFVNFTGIKVDGKEVDKANYVAKAGSTIVTLKEKFLETLAEGNHTLTFVYTNGEVAANFKVAKVEENPITNTETAATAGDTTTSSAASTTKTEVTVTPKTGDNVYIYIAIMIISGIALCITAKIMKKK